MITLAFMNDLFNGYGDVSYFEYLLKGALPDFYRQYLPYEQQKWNTLSIILKNIGRAVAVNYNGRINVLAGGRRRTYRHRRGKQNGKNSHTRRTKGKRRSRKA